jgi:MFS family permease
MPNKRYRSFVLILLTIVYGFNFIDRQIVGILAPYIQADLDLSNTQLGMLIGLAFALFYTIMGIPIAIIADRVNRVTLLSVALAVWSGFTALTGLAQNFIHIAFARVGVGVGEAGGSPPAHSIISDLYPKEERASALGVYAMGIPFGIMAAYFVTASLMGADADSVNWRRIFIILGVTGIVLAVFVKILIKEPRRGAMELSESSSLSRVPLGDALKELLRIKSWWFMALGIAAASFSAYSFGGFQTKFIRILDPDVDFRLVIIWLGIINGVAYASGTYLGAWLTDYWGKTNIKAYGLLPALAATTALPMALGAYWADSVTVHLIYATAWSVVIGTYLGPSFAIAQTLAPIQIRATSTALFFFVLNIIALGGGPTMAGFLIDVYGVSNDPLMSIRLALSTVFASLVISAILFLAVAKTLPRDWQTAEKRNQQHN